jgi:hypothetical protein
MQNILKQVSELCLFKSVNSSDRKNLRKHRNRIRHVYMYTYKSSDREIIFAANNNIKI